MRRISCFEQHYQMDEDIVKEACERVNLGIKDENELEMLRNEISKITESNESLVRNNEAMQHEIRSMIVEIGSMRKTINSIERFLKVNQK